MVQVDEDFVKKHYQAHLEKEFYPRLEKMITSSPVIAMVLQGIDAVENVQKLVGPTEPKDALPGTIRGDLAHHSEEWGKQKETGYANVVHASGNKKEAKEEVELWFDDDEIYDYKLCNSMWVE